MHEAAGMHLISTCTGNEVGSSYVLAFGSWITFVSCNALGVTLHIGIGDRTIDNGKQLIILVMMIIDSYQRLKDPYMLPWISQDSQCKVVFNTVDPSFNNFIIHLPFICRQRLQFYGM